MQDQSIYQLAFIISVNTWRILQQLDILLHCNDSLHTLDIFLFCSYINSVDITGQLPLNLQYRQLRMLGKRLVLQRRFKYYPQVSSQGMINDLFISSSCHKSDFKLILWIELQIWRVDLMIDWRLNFTFKGTVTM